MLRMLRGSRGGLIVVVAITAAIAGGMTGIILARGGGGADSDPASRAEQAALPAAPAIGDRLVSSEGDPSQGSPEEWFESACTGEYHEQEKAEALATFQERDELLPVPLVEDSPPPPFVLREGEEEDFREVAEIIAEDEDAGPDEIYVEILRQLRGRHIGTLIQERYPDAWAGRDQSSVPTVIRLKGPVTAGLEAWLAPLLGDDIVIEGGERFTRGELGVRARIVYCALTKQGFVASTGVGRNGIQGQVTSDEPLGPEVFAAIRAYALEELGPERVSNRGPVPAGGDLGRLRGGRR